MTGVKSPCTCREHADGAPTTIGGHVFALAERESSRYGTEWRASCSCSPVNRFRWSEQSPGVAYHAWLLHVTRVQAQAESQERRTRSVTVPAATAAELRKLGGRRRRVHKRMRQVEADARDVRDAVVAGIRRAYDDGLSDRQIAELIGFDRATVNQYRLAGKLRGKSLYGPRSDTDGEDDR